MGRGIEARWGRIRSRRNSIEHKREFGQKAGEITLAPCAADTSKVASRLSFPVLISIAALGVIFLSVFLQAASPIYSDDAWWHLRLGEAFWARGPWLQSDPLLFSAVAPPSPHSWLFDIFISGINQIFGLPGLRIFHGLACLGITVLAYRIFRRGRTVPVLALAATVLFLAMASDRLVRLRPDLFSITASLLLYQLLLADDAPPPMRRIAASVLLVALWANFHALFALGPLLLSVALCVWLVTPIMTRTRRFLPVERLWIKRLAASITFGLLAALINPLGIDQHLSFFRSSEGDALRVIGDDWTSFNPLSWEAMRGMMPFSTWVVADLVLGCFIVVAIYLLLRFLRDPESTPLASLQAPLLGLAAASLVAIASSSRFLWMAFFPILWLVRCLPVALSTTRGTGLAWGLTAICVAVMATFPTLRIFDNFRSSRRVHEYLAQNVRSSYPLDGVQFLADVALEGNLFSRYATSGFLGYWLEPRIQTLVNGSMNFPPEVFRDYFAILNKEGVEPGERFTDVLDRRKVDLYLGVGTPTSTTFLYTTPDLESDPQWLLIHRSLDHAIYLRRTPRNRENLNRVADYYAAMDIPFDRKTGLDVGVLLRRYTSWAIEQRMLPTHFPQLMRTRARNPKALNQLAVIHLLLGDYSSEIRLDEEMLALVPKALRPRRRLISSMLKLGRTEEAMVHIEILAKNGDPRLADMLLEVSRLQLAIEHDQELETIPHNARDLWRRDVNALFLILDSEVQRIKRFLLPPPALGALRQR